MKAGGRGGARSASTPPPSSMCTPGLLESRTAPLASTSRASRASPEEDPCICPRSFKDAPFPAVQLMRATPEGESPQEQCLSPHIPATIHKVFHSFPARHVWAARARAAPQEAASKGTTGASLIVCSPRDVDLSSSVSHDCCLQPVNSVCKSPLFFFNCCSH